MKKKTRPCTAASYTILHPIVDNLLHLSWISLWLVFVSIDGSIHANRILMEPVDI